MARRGWETPFATTRPVFAALAGLVVLGVAAVLVGAAVREHRDPTFHPDWAVWAPVALGIGLGVFGLASLAMLAQRMPPRPMRPAGPLPRPVASGTERALLRRAPLSPDQVASVPDLVERVGDRRQLVMLGMGPLYLVGGGVGLGLGDDAGFASTYLVIGGAWCVGAVVRLRRRRQVLDRARELGLVPGRARTGG